MKIHKAFITACKFFLALGILHSSSLMAQKDESAKGKELAQAHRCYSCHHEDQTLIGPPYLAIAARHGNDTEVMTKVLAEKIIRGGGGNWGLVPMVPNEHVSPEEARTIASWILNQQP